MDNLVYLLVLAVLGAAILACLFPLYQRRTELGGLLLSPALTMETLIARPDWVWGFSLYAIYGLLMLMGILGYSVGPMGAFMQLMVFILAAFVTMLFVSFSWAIRAFLIWLIALVFGARANFSLALCAVGYAFMPEALLGGLTLAAATAFTGGELGSSPIASSPFSLGHLLPTWAESGPLMGSLLNHVELFYLWSLTLTTLAVERVFSVSMNKAALIIVCYWAVSALLLAGLITLGTQVLQLI